MRLPAGWMAVNLGDVVDVNPRVFTQGPADDDVVSFVPMAAVEEESGRLDASMRRRWADVKSGYVRFQNGDVLFAKITPCMENGKFALASGLAGGRAAGSTEFHVLRPSAAIDGRYLLYYLLQASVRRDARMRMQGAAGQLRVPKAYLVELAIPLAPLAEQRRIVAAIEEHLSRLDAAVAGLKRVQAQLPRYRAAVLEAAADGRLAAVEQVGGEGAADWLGRMGVELEDGVGPFPGHDGWAQVPATRLAREAGYGTSEKCSYGATGPPVLRIPNVAPWRLDLTDMKRAIHQEGWGDAGSVAPGDFLIVRTNGSRDLIGRAVLVSFPLPEAHYFASYLIRLRLRGDRRLWNWVELWWSSPAARRGLEALAASSAGQYNISLTKLSVLPVPIPPPGIAEATRTELDRRLTTLAAVEQELDRGLRLAGELRQAVLSRAFEGNLVPQDPNDEPASVLLERIRAAQAAASAGARRAPAAAEA